MSSVIYILLLSFTNVADDDVRVLTHPYPMGALIAALTFLLAFRAQFAQSRWWEAYTTVHTMHSKWLDVGSCLAAFHLQAKKFDPKKPPAFGDHPEIDFVERERIRKKELTLEELEEQLQRFEKPASVLGKLSRRIHRQASIRMNAASSSSPTKQQQQQQQQQQRYKKEKCIQKKVIKGKPLTNSVIMSRKTRGIWAGTYEPLFLEEAAHLLSLLSAVAFSTLRNDVEYADSPLITFDPREPFPHVDPDDYKADVRRDWTDTHRSVQVLRYLLGISRSPANRTKYNAARPFRVIGGVSDSEIALLQAARGPLAKITLVSMWLQEFISREYMAGSMGAVASPIVSRLYQHASDGLAGWNQARKIAYVVRELAGPLSLHQRNSIVCELFLTQPRVGSSCRMIPNSPFHLSMPN